jgi:hypothetical protein
MPLIEQVLQGLPPDQRSLCFILERSDQGYMVEATLTRSTGNVLVRNECPQADHKAAIDEVVEKLAKQIRRGTCVVAVAGVIMMLCLIVGCESHDVAVKERTMVALPDSLGEGPGDAIVYASSSGESTAPSESPAYDSEDDADNFYDDLEPYGQWIQVEDYGPVWQPYNVAPGWRPYTMGHWVFTDDVGWYWVTDEPFGWCCYHYGRWAFVDRHGWCWCPGRRWGPAWVIWRRGGGYSGWAPMPPARRRLSIHVATFEPPHWAFSFVDERYITDERIVEHIEPVTRNVTLINLTQNITRYEVRNDRVVNHGVDVREVERVTGRPVRHHRLRDVADATSAGVHGDEVGVYRRKVPERRSPDHRPTSPFVSGPPHEESPAASDTRGRALADYHNRLNAEMQKRHRREVEPSNNGKALERLRAQQSAERAAFTVQRRREDEVARNHPKTLRRRESET